MRLKLWRGSGASVGHFRYPTRTQPLPPIQLPTTDESTTDNWRLPGAPSPSATRLAGPAGPRPSFEGRSRGSGMGLLSGRSVLRLAGPLARTQWSGAPDTHYRSVAAELQKPSGSDCWRSSGCPPARSDEAHPFPPLRVLGGVRLGLSLVLA